MKTSDLSGATLDYWVAKAVGKDAKVYSGDCFMDGRHRDEWTNGQGRYSPSTDWAQGGPLIERYRIDLECANLQAHLTKEFPDMEQGDENPNSDVWRAGLFNEIYQFGTLPLESGMRILVFSKFGDEVPDIAESE